MHWHVIEERSLNCKWAGPWAGSIEMSICFLLGLPVWLLRDISPYYCVFWSTIGPDLGTPRAISDTPLRLFIDTRIFLRRKRLQFNDLAGNSKQR